MSNPSNNDTRRLNHLQSDPIGNAFTPQVLAQFAAAGTGGYGPQAHSNQNAFLANSGSASSNQTRMSDFARDAYESAAKGNPIQRRPPAAQPIDFNTFSGCKFVVLDPYLIEIRDVYDQVSGTILWEVCADQEDRCVNFCKDNPTKRIFLVTCGSLGKNAVPKIHDLPQVYAIYVHCSNVPLNLEWSNKYSKVRVVCDNDDRDLIPQLAIDVAQTNIEWGDALIAKGERDKAIKKYEKALNNLETHGKTADPSMVAKVKDKLSKCK